MAVALTRVFCQRVLVHDILYILKGSSVLTCHNINAEEKISVNRARVLVFCTPYIEILGMGEINRSANKLTYTRQR
jgi:hypothetical protein